jgi:Mrp family chromosome partitioning ATPase
MARMLQALKNLEARVPPARKKQPEAAPAISLPPEFFSPPPAEFSSISVVEMPALVESPALVAAFPAAAPPNVSNSASTFEFLSFGIPEQGAAPRNEAARHTEKKRQAAPTEAGARIPTPLERTIQRTLRDPLQSPPLHQLADQISRDVAHSDSKSVVFVGVGKQSSSVLSLLYTAAILAEQGRDVLVVDADVARHRLTAGLQTSQETGLSELVTGNEAAKRFCRSTFFPRVWSLPAGQIRHVDLSTHTARAEEIFSQLTKEYPLVLIDGGCTAELAASAIARFCDVTYFVVQLGFVEASEAQEALRDFRAAGARVLGCIAT